jgi:hypothetical protein
MLEKLIGGISINGKKAIAEEFEKQGSYSSL